VKRALADANEYAIKWNSGRDLMPSSKVPILSYQDIMETLEKPIKGLRKEVQLPFDAAAKKKKKKKKIEKGKNMKRLPKRSKNNLKRKAIERES